MNQEKCLGVLGLRSIIVCLFLVCQGGCDEEPDLVNRESREDQEIEDSIGDDSVGERSTSDEELRTDEDTDSGRIDDYDGECPEAQVCLDVTGGGDFGCLLDGEVPVGNQEGCGKDSPCPSNRTCYSYLDGSGTVCIQDCYECQIDDDCDVGNFCDKGVCRKEPCTAGSCAAGKVCFEGTCIPDIGDGPGANPGIECDLPPLNCDPQLVNCSELIQFEPAEGVGYVDYPENGEAPDNQYRSWLRRDLMMLIQYAAAKVDCLAKGWSYGNGAPIGLIDMSEKDGAIPGTSINQPGHPPGTHVGGYDIDIAYYQAGVPDNRARPICDHYQGGTDAYHCTATPHLLDPWRQALFIGALFESPHLRVIGCDGKAGPMLVMAFGKICEKGWLPKEACSVSKLAYEEEDRGYGWFRFHHHHIHVSFSGTPSARSLMTENGEYRRDFPGGAGQCLIPDCRQISWDNQVLYRDLTRLPVQGVSSLKDIREK